jgi:hypothetical protein
MNELKISPLAPIRFYPVDYDFEQGDKFQNPDNRVSTGYDWEGVNPYPYHLAIPKQWPDGQPGIDTMVILDGDASIGSITAHLYDEDDAEVEEINCDVWETVSGDDHYHIWRNGYTSTVIADGLYTIKIKNPTSAVIYESDALLIGEWFDDFFPFEYSNFENDFGLIFNNGNYQWTGKMMIPMRLFDAAPEFEKQTYKNDPGVLTTLRTIPQRVFNFDTLPMNSHAAESFLLACSCSELYLDRINVNMEEMPEGEPFEGTNLQQINGKATFVDFNDTYSIERVEKEFTLQLMEWDSQPWLSNAVITGNSLEINNVPGTGTLVKAEYDQYSALAGEKIFLRIELTDDGSSDLPVIRVNGYIQGVVWGTNYLSVKFTNAGLKSIDLYGEVGDTLNLTCVVDWYSIDR